MSSSTIQKATMRTALLSTTAIVAASAVALMASARSAYALDFVVSTTENFTRVMGSGTGDNLTISGSGAITLVSPGVGVIDLADFIDIQSTGVAAEIDATEFGIQIQGTAADLTGGIAIASGAIITATTTGGGTDDGTGILVQSGGDISGGITNSGAIEGYDLGILVKDAVTISGASISGASISGGITNTGAIFGNLAAIAVGYSLVDTSTIGAINNNGFGVIGVDIGNTSVAYRGIAVGGVDSDITGLITNSSDAIIVGRSAAILVAYGGDISGGITNAGMIGQVVTAGTTVTAGWGISVISGGDISGTITNSGTIVGSDIAIYAANASFLFGGVANSGDITGGDVAIKIRASGLGSASYIGLNNSGTISGNAAIDINVGSTVYGITNSGAIFGTGGNTAISANASQFNGNITNNSGGVIGANALDAIVTSDAIGIGFTNTDSTGGIANTGVITGAVRGIALISGSDLTGAITNNALGTIGSYAGLTSGAVSATTGIYVFKNSSVSGGIDNSGSIEGSSKGIVLEEDSTLGTTAIAGIINNTNGLISGGATGIGIDHSTVLGGISNSGNILGGTNVGVYLNNTGPTGPAVSTTIAALSNTSTGVIAAAGTAILIENGAEITGVLSNVGIIGNANTGGGTAARGLLVNGTASDIAGGVNNSGTIKGTNAAIEVSFGGAISGGITNTGLIQNSMSAVVGYGIFVSAGSSVTSITNSGTISGGTGSIQFGNADSTLTLQTGSVLSGDADGGVGTNDSLVLEGYGTEDSVFIDFENLTVSASSAGTWHLTGDSDFAALTVNSGTLDITGTVHTNTASVGTSGDLHIDGTLDVASGVTVGGILSGDGAITGTGTLTVNGVFSPGNSPGTFTSALAFVQGNDSSYLVEHEVGASPETDNAVITNTATIGTNVDIDLVVGAGTDGFQDVILTATSITGEYDDINADDNLAALVVYDATTATLFVAKTDALAASAATVSDAGFVFLENLQEGARRDGRVWATGYIYNAENEGLGQNGADFDQDAFGFNAGVDVISQPNLKVGLAIGYLDGDIDIQSSTSGAENDGIFGAAYLNYMNDNFYLDGTLMVGQQTVDTTRTLSNSTATASIDATSYGANLEAGFELEALGGRLSPFVKVGIHSASLDGYSEAATAGTGAMTVGEVETRQMRVGAGFRYAIDLGSADGIQVTPAIKVGMTQEWHDGDSSADIGFVGYTGSTTASLDFEDQTTIDLGLSFDVKLSEAVTAFLGWDATLGDEATRNTGTIGLSVSW